VEQNTTTAFCGVLERKERKIIGQRKKRRGATRGHRWEIGRENANTKKGRLRKRESWRKASEVEEKTT